MFALFGSSRKTCAHVRKWDGRTVLLLRELIEAMRSRFEIFLRARRALEVSHSLGQEDIRPTISRLHGIPDSTELSSAVLFKIEWFRIFFWQRTFQSNLVISLHT